MRRELTNWQMTFPNLLSIPCLSSPCPLCLCGESIVTMQIAEIYRSVQGEGLLTGVPSVFVRTSGCNLRCWFCDTPYTSWQPEGRDMSIDEIVAQVEEWDCAARRRHRRRADAVRRVDSALRAAARDRPAHHDRNGRHAVSAGRVRLDVDQPEVRQLGAVGRRSTRIGAGGTSASGIGPRSIRRLRRASTSTK